MYTSTQPEINDIEEYVKKRISKSLSENDKIYCDRNISLKDCEEEINAMKINKSPGLDGLPVEFYRIFWNQIKYNFYCAVVEIYKSGYMAPSMRTAVLSLLFKKEDRQLMKNYRPISLLNCDYKIIAAILAKRLQTVLCKIINENQSGYLKGRFIGNNIRLTCDIFEYAEIFNKPGAIIMLDYEKAFDTLEWPFIISVLKHSNFGDYFINWIKILYKNPNFCVKNNGWISSTCQMTRGIRQGCPVSALLFVLAAEILANSIRTNLKIEGFSFRDADKIQDIKISQYADDTCLLLTNKSGIEESLREIKQFSVLAGPKLNMEKTVGIWLGPWKNNSENFLGITWTKNAVRYLGIYIGHNEQEVNRLNWDKKISNLQLLLKSWKQRNLTLLGKVTVLKSLALSNFVLNGSVLAVSQGIINHINKCVYNFLWNKNERIKRNVLISNFEDGGIRMPDIDSIFSSLKAVWILRLIEKRVPSYEILNCYLQKYGLNILLCSKANVTKEKLFDIMKILPTFYKQVFLSFYRCKSQSPLNEMTNDTILRQFIWGNHLFMHQGKTLCFKSWIKSNILYVNDLFSDQNRLLTSEEMYDKLKYKQNWLAEYSIIKKTFRNMNSKLSSFINIKPIQKVTLTVDNKETVIKGAKSKYFYNLLIKKKCEKSYIQQMWKRKLNLDEYIIPWSKIFTQQIQKYPIKKIAEFNLKLIHNILPCSAAVAKWNKNVLSTCSYCNVRDDICHMLYSCQLIMQLWQMFSSVMQIRVEWKHLVLGYKVYEDGKVYKEINFLLSYICYSIFKYTIGCRINNNIQTKSGAIFIVKQDLEQLRECQVYLKSKIIQLIDLQKLINSFSH